MSDLTIEIITPDEACQRMRAAGINISPVIIRGGIKQKVFPFGDAVETEKGHRFFVYARLLTEWMEQRATYGTAQDSS